MRTRIAVTLGDPRGIGPEVAFQAAAQEASPDIDITFFGNDALRGQLPVGCDFESLGVFDGSEQSAGRISALAIQRSVERAIQGDYRAVVTAPVSKPALHAAGHDVPGQTEFLQQLTGCRSVGMLMAAESTHLGPPLRVLLATTHQALRDVPKLVTEDLLTAQALLLSAALQRDWGIAEPRLVLCALNPHASDGGLFGDEEARVFEPAVRRVVSTGVDLTGPLPADTVFQRALAGHFDAVIAPYHDVGMAAFKTVSFGSGVNVTLGLPFIRTSPDHGTAFDIAGTGRADPSSMCEALRLACRLVSARFDTDSADV
jgi:4-hydroxythreonine-4-phosphate dehydrogenase